MTSHRLTEPAVAPVTVEEMRAHLRVVSSVEDGAISGFVRAAADHVEQATRRAFITQGWRLYLDAWPVGRIVRLPVAPVASVDQVVVYGADGVPQTLDPSDWTLMRGGEPARLKVELGAGPPHSELQGIEIDFTAGYGAAPEAVPEVPRQAVRLLAAHWYENREAGAETAMASLPHGLDRLLSTLRVPLL